MKIIKISIFLLTQFFFFASLQSTHAQVARNFQHAHCLCLPVAIASQPVSPDAVCPGEGIAAFSVNVSGTGPFTYKWKENGMMIADGGLYSGSQTTTLTITNPQAALNGKHYQCIITNCMGQSVSTNNSAMLSVHLIPGDINADGVVNNNDFSLMNLVYNTSCSNCPEDIIPDGFVDVKDFLQLLGTYNRTCQ